MIKVTASLEGMDLLSKKLEAIARADMGELNTEILNFGFAIQRTAKRSIASSPVNPETGRSFPGNPPHTDTGLLAASIFVDQTTEDGKVSVEVGTNVKYGPWLEFGTQNMAARPWLGPAFNQNKPDAMARIREAIKALLKKRAADSGGVA